MAIVVCKASARLKALTPGLLRILKELEKSASVITDPVREVVITSINDGKHAPTSRHYTDEAVDIRMKNFPTDAARKRFISDLRHWLGPEFYILRESKGTPNDHLHVQVRKGHTYIG